MEKQSVFINPFVDRGFKILFGQKESKDLLIELLNDLLEGERHIEDLTYMDKENPKKTIDGRGAIFDLKCVDTDGTIFIIGDTGKQMSNVFREIFIEFPLFNKTEAECETPLDYWLYNLKHMEQLEHLSFNGQKALFVRLEELARIAEQEGTGRIRGCPENIPR